MTKFLAILFLVCVSNVLIAQNDVTGIWYNTTKSGKIEIVKKGNNYLGKIIWLDEPFDEVTGKAKVDQNNPDKDKQNKPIIGLQVLQDFEFDGENKFTGGTIYDPENGKTYKCKMTLVDNDHLDVRGYIGFPALGRTENWTRTTN